MAKPADEFNFDDLLAEARKEAVRISMLAPLKRLKRANSYSRMHFLLDCSRRTDFWALVRDNWTTCDNISRYKRRLTTLIERRNRLGPIIEAMDEKEWACFDALPRTVTVWRGCYPNNIDGLSWSIDRDVAKKFPTYTRYQQDGLRPILVEGRIARSRVAFVKLDRKEQEIVALPRHVRQRVHWFIEKSPRARHGQERRTPRVEGLGARLTATQYHP